MECGWVGRQENGEDEASVLGSEKYPKRGRILGLMIRMSSGSIWNFKNQSKSEIQISQRWKYECWNVYNNDLYLYVSMSQSLSRVTSKYNCGLWKTLPEPLLLAFAFQRVPCCYTCPTQVTSTRRCGRFPFWPYGSPYILKFSWYQTLRHNT